jgi:hypothetical protein
MMSLFGQVRKLMYLIRLFVAGMKTSERLFLNICCRYLDSFIEMYHVIGDPLFIVNTLTICWCVF